jgi:hypothetical protein
MASDKDSNNPSATPTLASATEMRSGRPVWLAVGPSLCFLSFLRTFGAYRVCPVCLSVLPTYLRAHHRALTLISPRVCPSVSPCGACRGSEIGLTVCPSHCATHACVGMLA